MASSTDRVSVVSPRSARASLAARLGRKVAVSALLAVPLLGAGVVAVSGGGVTPDATQPPLTNPIVSPNTCQSCHGDFDNVNNVEPHVTWAGSMMANSSRDPLFWAALDVANNDIAGVGDFCLRCHVPTGWLAGRSEPPGGSVDGCSLVGDLDSDAGDFAGVSCELCHRMMENTSPPPGEQSIYYDNAKYWVDDGECSGDPCRRGPYDYPPGGDVPPPHTWEFSQYHLDPDICGNCHNVTHPATTLINQAGVNTGILYPIERTFLEWQQSDFSVAGPGFQSCQDCHMVDASASPVYACIQEENDRTGNLAVHQFAGGNTWVPRILRDEYSTLASRSDSYDATIAWATDLLQNQSATVALTAPAEIPGGDDLSLSVRVTNLTGHKLPTGYTEGRRMWLQTEVRDGDDNLIYESGAYNASTGELTHDADIKVYHRESGIWNRNGTNECDITDGGGDPIFHFVLNDCIKIDNRIPPAGFTGGSDLESQPVGYTYPETSPGSGVLVNYDDTGYMVTVPSDTPSPLSVTTRLLYQTASKEYIEFLRDEAIDNSFPDDCLTRGSFTTPAMSRGEILYDMWTRYDRSPPVVMREQTAMVTINNDIFVDGFESGNTNAWSNVAP